jgi:hypothetical protein
LREIVIPKSFHFPLLMKKQSGKTKFGMVAVIAMAQIDNPDLVAVAAVGIQQRKLWIRGQLKASGLSQGRRNPIFGRSDPAPPPLDNQGVSPPSDTQGVSLHSDLQDNVSFEDEFGSFDGMQWE